MSCRDPWEGIARGINHLLAVKLPPPCTWCPGGFSLPTCCVRARVGEECDPAPWPEVAQAAPAPLTATGSIPQGCCGTGRDVEQVFSAFVCPLPGCVPSCPVLHRQGELFAAPPGAPAVPPPRCAELRGPVPPCPRAGAVCHEPGQGSQGSPHGSCTRGQVGQAHLTGRETRVSHRHVPGML